MTDDDDELRAFAKAFFSSTAPPDDVVDRGAWRGLTATDLARLSNSANTWAQIVTPGELVEDPDGNPLAMTPPEANLVYRGPAVVTRAQLYKAGLTESSVPNLTITD